MIMSEFRQLYGLLVLAVLLVIAGFVFDGMFVQPRLAEVGRLRTRNLQLLEERKALAVQNREHQSLTRSLRLDEVSEVFVDDMRSDPAVFVSDLLRQTEVTILEIVATESTSSGRLRKSGFTVRVLGGFERILHLVRTLEKEKRLVTIDAFSIQPLTGTSQLEGRFEVSIFDPVVRR